MNTTCPYCGWPDDAPYQVVSRHRTPRGLTVWTRCACGSVQVRVVDETGMRIAARSQPRTAAECPA